MRFNCPTSSSLYSVHGQRRSVFTVSSRVQEPDNIGNYRNEAMFLRFFFQFFDCIRSKGFNSSVVVADLRLVSLTPLCGSL